MHRDPVRAQFRDDVHSRNAAVGEDHEDAYETSDCHGCGGCVDDAPRGLLLPSWLCRLRCTGLRGPWLRGWTCLRARLRTGLCPRLWLFIGHYRGRRRLWKLRLWRGLLSAAATAAEIWWSRLRPSWLRRSWLRRSGTAARVTRRRPVMAVRLRVARATVVPAVLRLAMGNRPGRRVDMPVRSASPVVRWVRLREGNHNMCRAPVRLINAATATEEALGGLRLRRPSAFSDRVVQSGLTRTAATAGLGAEARQPPFDWLRLRFVAVGDDLGLARLPH